MKKFWTRNESGDSEIISVLFVVPIIVFLLFTMIEMSMFMNTKSTVEAANRDGVRQAALWGGTGAGVRLNGTTKDIGTIIDDDVQSSVGKRSKSSCVTVGSGNGVAARAGQEVRCTTTLDYQPVAGGTFMFGLESVIEKDIVVVESSYTETGYTN